MNKNVLTKILRNTMCLYFLTFFSVLSADNFEYKYILKDLGTLSNFKYSRFENQNEEGQIVLYLCPENDDDDDDFYENQRYCIWDKSLGLQILPLEIEEVFKINNHGWMICKGTKREKVIDRDGCEYHKNYKYRAIWDQDGQKLVYLTDVQDEDSPPLIDINDHNQIVGINDDKKIFFYENGDSRYLDIDKELATLGYHPMSFSLIKINNKGEILCKFNNGEKHPFKDKWRNAGMVCFFWDGNVHIVETSEFLDLYTPDYSLFYLTDDSEVYYCLSHYHHEKNIFKWNKESGKKIFHPMNEINIFACKKVSKNLLNGYESHYKLVDRIWQNGTLKFESSYDASFLSLFDSTQYPGVEFTGIEAINNRGQLIIKGSLWKEDHVFLLDPIQ